MTASLRFRAWHKESKKMKDLHALTPLALNADIPGVFIPFLDDVVVMQSTGLKDKNDKEIFEGDIVRDVRKDGGGIGVVHFKAPGFIVCEKESRESWLGGGLGYPADQNQLKNTEVLGNVHENRDLLP